MSRIQKTGLFTGVVVAALAAAAIALFAVRTSARDVPREIVLVGRGMAFYVDGNPAPNPTIRVRAGETVRLTVRNETPGMVHDLAVPALAWATDPVPAGEVLSRTLQVPDAPGSHTYVCRPHAVMMTGTLEVVQ